MFPRRAVAIALSLAFALIAADARGEESAKPEGLFEREQMTGDWGGLRTSLKDKGFSFTGTYIADFLGNSSGGARRKTSYAGRLDLGMDVDLEKLVDWSGAKLHANAFQTTGRGLSASALGNNLLKPSGVEAQPATRLYTLWLEQAFWSDKASLRLGQLAADDEFMVSDYAATFVNSTFGWPGSMGANLPNGGPSFPLATPGVRLKLQPTANWSLLAALFNGDPAGPGPNPEQRNGSGVEFRTGDGVFAIAELAYSVNAEKDAKGLKGTYKLGGWLHSARRFADQRFDAAGRSIADPLGAGVARQRRGDAGLYAMIDQMVWKPDEAGDQGLALFARLSLNPDDRNQISVYGDVGATYKGIIPGRDDDVLGLAFGYAKISDRASDLDRDIRRFSGQNTPIRDYEAVIELTYQFALAPWWILQPDLQYIMHPGGNILPPNATGTAPMRNAFIGGVRTVVKF